jgi:hypothetical protein
MTKLTVGRGLSTILGRGIAGAFLHRSGNTVFGRGSNTILGRGNAGVLLHLRGNTILSSGITGVLLHPGGTTEKGLSPASQVTTDIAAVVASLVAHVKGRFVDIAGFHGGAAQQNVRHADDVDVGSC